MANTKYSNVNDPFKLMRKEWDSMHNYPRSIYKKGWYWANAGRDANDNLAIIVELPTGDTHQYESVKLSKDEAMGFALALIDFIEWLPDDN